ncbi:MAG: MFS transporter, partial [Actinomycetota bacterium]|nr:MFS transporter [Actinomycetota bacterium]
METRAYDRKWRAFWAIGVAFVTNVFSMSMVFVALPSIADDYDTTLRAVGWVVIAQALTISSLMMPMGRLADQFGRRRMHLSGLALFGVGSLAVSLAPSFGLLIAARVLMAIGNAMGQSVGTAMVVAVFPPHERGKAIGSQTTAVAIGAASGPIVAGLLLSVLPWEALFQLLLIPIALAFVAGYRILDEELVTPPGGLNRLPFDPV